MLEVVLAILAFAALIAGSVTDLKTREVPDWITYSLIAGALGMRLLQSTLNNEFTSFLNSAFFIGLAGFFACLIISNILYFGKQWGGGDAKLLMGIGAILGATVNLLFFFLLLIFVGAFYGIIWSIGLAIKNKQKFKKSFNENLHDFKLFVYVALLLFILGIILLFWISDMQVAFLTVSICLIASIGMFSFLFTKSIEDSCLISRVKPSQLTEGDWVAETIKMNGKVIVNEKNLGLTKEQLKKLQRYKKTVLVKVGIPFIPSFLLAYLALLLARTWLQTLFS